MISQVVSLVAKCDGEGCSHFVGPAANRGMMSVHLSMNGWLATPTGETYCGFCRDKQPKRRRRDRNVKSTKVDDRK